MKSKLNQTKYIKDKITKHKNPETYLQIIKQKSPSVIFSSCKLVDLFSEPKKFKCEENFNIIREKCTEEYLGFVDTQHR